MPAKVRIKRVPRQNYGQVFHGTHEDRNGIGALYTLLYYRKRGAGGLEKRHVGGENKGGWAQGFKIGHF